MDKNVYYAIEKLEENSIRVTLTLPSKEAIQWFHDQVAIKIAEPGRFIGEIYEAYRGLGESSIGIFKAREDEDEHL